MSTPETDGSERRPPAPAPLWVRGLPVAIGVLSVLLVVLVVALLRGGDDDATATESAGAATTKAPPPPPELPRGGRRLLPDFRVVTFAGAPQDPELGELGVGSSLRAAVGRLQKQARVYRRKTRPEQPALQLISTVVHAAPGPDGQFNMHQSRATIARHLREARRAKALLILDVQPGRASFVTETERLTRWLREPDVALALDPEWRMERAGQIPGQVIGSVGARELQRSLDVVAGVVRKHDLPPKMVLVHRFTEDMVRGLEHVRVPREVQAVMSIDGVGDRANKEAKYRQLTRDLPKAWRPGFKLFYREDREAGGLMTPAQVMALKPRPQVVMYE